MDVILLVLGVVAGLGLGAVAGYLYSGARARSRAEAEGNEARDSASRVVEEARRDAENARREADLAAKEAAIRIKDEAEAEAGEAMGLLRRASQQYHWEDEGYGSFEGFLGALSSRKRKTIRHERAVAQVLDPDAADAQEVRERRRLRCAGQRRRRPVHGAFERGTEQR